MAAMVDSSGVTKILAAIDKLNVQLQALSSGQANVEQVLDGLRTDVAVLRGVDPPAAKEKAPDGKLTLPEAQSGIVRGASAQNAATTSNAKPKEKKKNWKKDKNKDKNNDELEPKAKEPVKAGVTLAEAKDEYVLM